MSNVNKWFCERVHEKSNEALPFISDTYPEMTVSFSLSFFFLQCMQGSERDLPVL